ncbi:MAG: CDP-glycerol glycerophosphotransferase family protein [Melioribacteraceae bacterium]|nr:CDP-glycerol glycerophosphotransferase family protein [Melioribacteraceae bacterium]
MKLGIINFIKKMRTNIPLKAKVKYTSYYEKNFELADSFLFESYHGKQIASNEFYLLKELSERNIPNVAIYVCAQGRSVDAVKNRLSHYNINNVNVVVKDSDQYCKLLCTSKYLINSTSFPDYFIKRKGQVYLNTWHGTPLKTMGRKDKIAPQSIANIQRNLLMSDYLLFPNEHTKTCFIEDYMLAKLYRGQYVLAGYPRNKVFYDTDARIQIRDELGLSDKKVIVYMPTWRGQLGKLSNNKVIAYTYVMIDKLSKSLKGNEVLYVSLHYLMNKGIKYSDFDNVHPFPKVETYDFLNAADTLITDYSSVMFDFANTGRQVILYTYDKEDYETYRGTYIDIDLLPFPRAATENELIDLLHAKDFESYEDFTQQFCQYDKNDNAKYLIDLLLEGIIDERISIEKNKLNKKEMYLISAGNLAKNGITASLKSLLSQLDLNGKDYFLTFSANAVKAHYKELHLLPSNVDFIPYRGMVNFTKLEAVFLFLFYKLNISHPYIINKLDRVYKRELKRIYPNFMFNKVIQFNGYDRQNINLLARVDAKKAIYVHNNMWREMQERRACHKATMNHAYSEFDRIAIVTEQLRESTLMFNCDDKKIKCVENTHPHDLIVEKSLKDVAFDEDTRCNIPFEQLLSVLDDKKLNKFVNVARFSPEKGHERLIRAFERVYQKDKDSRLVIIGGHGALYKQTLLQANSSIANEAIIIIRSMSNPFPVMKKCDLFVFSSVYEGLGLVMLESLSVGVPVVSTDIPGPRGFLSKGYGTLVPDNEDGLYDGMMKFLNGEIKAVDVDWKAYNRNAVEQFNQLLN